MYKVLHIITSLELGGAEAVMYRLLLNTTNTEEHCVISLKDSGYFGDKLESCGIKVISLGMKSGTLSIGAFIKLVRIIKDMRPTVVQTYMYHADFFGGTAAFVSGCPRIVWGLHNSNLDVNTVKKKTILVAKACALLSHIIPSMIVSCSKKAVDVHTDIGYKRNKFHVIPNGYDTSIFVPNYNFRTSIRNEFGIGDNDIVIGIVARFDPQKDHINFLDAVAFVATKEPNVHFILCGNGMTSDNNILANKAKMLGIIDKCYFIGKRDDIPSIMNALDFHVLSSSYGEAFPNVVAEAMSCGVPCVVTDVGDCAEMVGDAGWVVLPRNSRALADAILQAIGENNELRNKRKIKSRELICEKYNINKIVGEYNDIWNIR